MNITTAGAIILILLITFILSFLIVYRLAKTFLLRDLPLWKKYGILFSAFYCIAIIIIILGGFVVGEISGYIIMFSTFPVAWLLYIAGFNDDNTGDAFRYFTLLLIINIAFSFAIGSLFGHLYKKFFKK